MPASKARPTTITEYFNAAPKAARPKLRQLRAIIRKAAPGAVESLKWGMPAFSYQRILVTIAAFPHHVGLYPTPSAMKAFAAELEGYVTGKGSIQFPLDRPLPVALVRRIIAFRVRESVERDEKWRS